MTDAQLQAKAQLLAQFEAKFEALSPEYKAKWEYILKYHPWIKRDKDGNPTE